MSRKFNSEQDKFYISRRKFSNRHVKHVHDFYELLYLTSGERHFFINDRTFRALEGDFILIRPNVIHRAKNTIDLDCEGVLVYFDESFINNDSMITSLSSVFERDHMILRLPVKYRAMVEESLVEMIEERNQASTGYQLMLESKLMEMLVRMARFIESHGEMDFDYQNPMHKKIAEIVRYINEHYSGAISLSDLAGRFYISAPYLSKIFKSATGYTVVEYINNVRVKEAISLLRQSEMKVLDVSETVGFGSVTHFGRVFKEVTGKSPKQYKK